MLNQTLKAITSFSNIHDAECYNVWFVTGFVFFLLVCFVIFNENKIKRIKELEDFILKEKREEDLK